MTTNNQLTVGKVGFTLLLLSLSSVLAAQSSFIAFESGSVRPLALSSDGNTLFVTNTPDNRLEFVDVSTDTPVNTGSVQVGLEPIAVAVLDSDTVFVANHLSDSVSVIKLSPTPHISQTLLVGDEPRDLVLADPDGDGPLDSRLFITTARRGQHRNHVSLSSVPGAGDPNFTEASTPRADVWVFDTGNLGDALGGLPLKIVELFSDTPRALAVSPDGTTVYAAAHFSGNGSTIIGSSAVCNGFEQATQCTRDGISSPGGLPNGLSPGGNPGPSANAQGVAAPEVGLIVQWNPDADEFQDELGRNWNNGVRFSLPDKDVFAIDSLSLDEIAFHSRVGTTIFNMAVNPVTGVLYVSNTEANNRQRFEGPGTFTGSTVQGNLARSRITVIAEPDSSGTDVTPRHLNKHIDYAELPASLETRESSVSTPLEMVIDRTGTELYLAAFGSNGIAYYDTDELEQDLFTPSQNTIIDLSGGGPAGLVLNEEGTRLYTLTRFDNGISIIDTESKIEIAHSILFNPEPDSIVAGRPFLYDARLTSSNGEASCGSCHIFGDTDHLAWDLGNPDGLVTLDPIPTILGFAAPANSNGGAGTEEFHPMKGPMGTQTMRGLANSGAMHWRGDRSNGEFGIDATDEDLSFRNFVEAFPGLVGREEDISDADMQAFADFQLQVFLPPNPNRQLNNSLRAAEQRGSDFFHSNRLSDGVPLNTTGPILGRTGFTCNGCHEHDAAQGFFGTGTNQSFEGSDQIIKVPHLRNGYTKVGMFGMPRLLGFSPETAQFQGDQVRGFGFLHDASVDTLKSFFSVVLFQESNNNGQGFSDAGGHRDMEQFMLSFDTDLAPIVGQQITYSAISSQETENRIDLLMQRATTAFVSKSLGGNVVEADLVVKATVDGIARGFIYEGANNFLSDQNEVYSKTELQCLAYTDGPLTFTAVPPGSGDRIGLDRDSDSVYDGLDPQFVNLTRIDTTPDEVDTQSATYLSCLEEKNQRIVENTNFDCDSQSLSFPVLVNGNDVYQISMSLIDTSPIRFELTDAQPTTTTADNVASFSAEEGLLLPVTRVSCGNTVTNMQMRHLSDGPVVFEVKSFDL